VGSGIGLPDAPGNTGEIPKTYEEIQQVVFEPLCASQCHRGGAAPKGLSLESNRAHANLVGVPSVEVPGLLRVAPGSPEDSYLIVKLAPFDSRRVGARMPRNGPPFITNAQLGALRRWIRAGAAADWIDSEVDAATMTDAPPPADADPTDAAIDANMVFIREPHW